MMVIRIIGIILALVAMWGGSFVTHSLGIDHWSTLPVIVTAVLAFTAGLVMAVIGNVKEL